MVSISLNVASPSLKNARLPAGLSAATVASGPPAPAAPPRTPGSVCANAIPATNSIMSVSVKTGAFLLVIASSSGCFRIVDLQPGIQPYCRLLGRVCQKWTGVLQELPWFIDVPNQERGQFTRRNKPESM